MAPEPGEDVTGEAQAPPSATAPPDADPRKVRFRRTLRRAIVLALAVFLLLGLVGLLGPSTGETTASAEGWELSVTHPRVTRPGLSARLTIEIRRPGGFDLPVVLALESSYLDVFDESSVEPEPVEATADASRSLWTFAAPTSGDTLTVDVSGRVEAGLQLRRVSGRASILVADQPVVDLSWKTYLTP
ncbi:MAG TPA: hypothetical protein VHH09_06645 [Acidimicrobiales bacterium]|nr:hypothetical protein [Acidimicrobiales bacterium]